MSSKSVRIDSMIVEAARSEGILRSEHLAGAGDEDLWRFKRQRQEADLAALVEGRVTQDQLSWFSGGKARKLKVIDSPY
jgi:hypothetical protein